METIEGGNFSREETICGNMAFCYQFSNEEKIITHQKQQQNWVCYFMSKSTVFVKIGVMVV